MFLTKEQAQDLDFIKSITSKHVDVQTIIPKIHWSASNSFTYDVNDDTIFKFAKNNHTEVKLRKEATVLNLLRGKTKMPIPSPTLHDSEYVYMVYKKIPGESVESDFINAMSAKKHERFCDDIANFVFEMHRQTDWVRQTTDIGRWDRSGRNYAISEIIAQLSADAEFTASEIKFVEKFYSRFEPYEYDDKFTRFCHIDLQLKNIAFNLGRQRVSGIYDFGECSIDDGHLDFAQMAVSMNPHTVSAILRRYAEISGFKFDINKIYDYYLHLYLCAYVSKWDGADKIKQVIKFRRGLKFK
jgi:Ser/Thr protein kinase RdoA (MazF antagonist)